MTLTPHTRPMAVLVGAWAAAVVTVALFLPGYAAVVVGVIGGYALVCLAAAVGLADGGPK